MKHRKMTILVCVLLTGVLLQSCATQATTTTTETTVKTYDEAALSIDIETSQLFQDIFLPLLNDLDSINELKAADLIHEKGYEYELSEEDKTIEVTQEMEDGTDESVTIVLVSSENNEIIYNRGEYRIEFYGGDPAANTYNYYSPITICTQNISLDAATKMIFEVDLNAEIVTSEPVSTTARQICEHCDGEGYIVGWGYANEWTNEKDYFTYDCPYCDGRGYVR